MTETMNPEPTTSITIDIRAVTARIEERTALMDSLKEELTGLLAVIDFMTIGEITNLRAIIRNGDGWFGK